MVNGDVDVVNGQVMARSLVVEDQNADGNTWAIQEDTGSTGALVFYYSGTSTNQMALTTAGQLVVNSLAVATAGTITDLRLGTLVVTTTAGAPSPDTANTAGSSLILCDMSLDSLTITLDAADNVVGKILFIIITANASNTLTIQPVAPATVNASPSLSLPNTATRGDGYMVFADGTNWWANAL